MRTTIDIPDRIYRQLKTRAANQGQTTKALILQAVTQTLSAKRAPAKRRITLPLVRSKRPGTLRLDNARIYDVISFP